MQGFHLGSNGYQLGVRTGALYDFREHREIADFEQGQSWGDKKGRCSIMKK